MAKNKLRQLLALKKDKRHYADCVIRNGKGQILFNGVPTIGEDLYAKWILNKTRFDKGEIDNVTYFNSIALYKGTAALELVKRAFDEGQISNEKFMTYFNKTTDPIKELLKYSGSCSNEQLQEIV